MQYNIFAIPIRKHTDRFLEEQQYPTSVLKTYCLNLSFVIVIYNPAILLISEYGLFLYYKHLRPLHFLLLFINSCSLTICYCWCLDV